MKKAEDTVRQNEAQSSEGQHSKQQPSLKGSGKKVEFAEIPVVHVVFGPAELIEIKGEPKYSPIAGTGLEYVSNTNGNIFQLAGRQYLLLSGRWFTSATLDGPWTFVTPADMPTDFAKIPMGSPKVVVLASVPGTPQAKEALIANAIPQTATITRSEAKLTVQYDGEPRFVPMEGTSMSYAKNTSAAVIKYQTTTTIVLRQAYGSKRRRRKGLGLSPTRFLRKSTTYRLVRRCTTSPM
jgi:hypothetical protein